MVPRINRREMISAGATFLGAAALGTLVFTENAGVLSIFRDRIADKLGFTKPLDGYKGLHEDVNQRTSQDPVIKQNTSVEAVNLIDRAISDFESELANPKKANRANLAAALGTVSVNVKYLLEVLKANGVKPPLNDKNGEMRYDCYPTYPVFHAATLQADTKALCLAQEINIGLHSETIVSAALAPDEALLVIGTAGPTYIRVMTGLIRDVQNPANDVEDFNEWLEHRRPECNMLKELCGIGTIAPNKKELQASRK